jgi:4-hydroxy 2-oxovalerate aldolase
LAQIILSDSTLRDGNHAVAQQINFGDMADFLKRLDLTGVDWIEVGHGNGLGASSLNFGQSPNADSEIIRIARENVTSAKLSAHAMPGIATFKDDVRPALDAGLDIVRVASHCTEADSTATMIEAVADHGATAVGVLMMVHRISAEELAEQAKLMFESGASSVMLMDSAGSLSDSATAERVSALVGLSKGPVGFHAHNNMGLAISNSLTAIRSGASIIDGTCKGFGAGAGNAPLELVIANLPAASATSHASLGEYLQLADEADAFGIFSPDLTPLSIITGTNGIFSGFSRQIKAAALLNDVSWLEIARELASFETVAGQEDLVFEIAAKLASKKGK